MKIYKATNVFDEALKRIRFIFDEFPEVVISFSGGKDSTAVLNLALIVAKEKNRLPLKVFFLDQEAEWQAVIDYIRSVMTLPEVKPLWYQVPFKIFNATSTTEHFLEAWGPGLDWMRPKEPFAITENKTGVERFHDMFAGALRVEAPTSKACYLAGVRTEESPARFIGLTHHKKYKWITYAKTLDKKLQHFTFYPIYDWALSDVWKAIGDNKWPYCPHYDSLYRYGRQPSKIRVSNVLHETAVNDLFYLQELEPATYAKLTKRIAGVDMSGKLGFDDFFIRKLPFMFNSWKEYRDYLLEHLITNPEHKGNLRSKFDKMDAVYAEKFGDTLYTLHVQSILTNDWEGIKLENFERSPLAYAHRKGTPLWMHNNTWKP